MDKPSVVHSYNDMLFSHKMEEIHATTQMNLKVMLSEISQAQKKTLNKLRVTRKAMPEPQDGELKIRVKAWSSIRAFLAFFLSLFARSELRGSGWQSLGGHAARGEEPPWAAPRAPSPALRAFPAAPWPADAGKEAGRQALGALPKPDLGVTGGDGELREGKGGRWRPALRVWLIAPRELSVEQDSSGARRGRFDGNMVRKP